MTGDEFSSTRQIIDVELNYAQSTKHRQKAHLSVIDAGIQDEVSSHGYADIDELNSDDYVNVKEELNNSDDDDEFDYENLRDGVWKAYLIIPFKSFTLLLTESRCRHWK